jgi:hypothetical protein
LVDEILPDGLVRFSFEDIPIISILSLRLVPLAIALSSWKWQSSLLTHCDKATPKTFPLDFESK